MQHLLLQFAELPQQENVDLSIIEYDVELNLNVIKGTKTPAVTFIDEATETFTKTAGEGSDSDKDASNAIALMFDTSTQTFVNNEGSDSDKNFKDITYLSTTQTLTESPEIADSDK